MLHTLISSLCDGGQLKVLDLVNSTWSSIFYEIPFLNMQLQVLDLIALGDMELPIVN